MEILDFGFWILDTSATGFGFAQLAQCKFWILDFGLRIMDYGLRIMDLVPRLRPHN